MEETLNALSGLLLKALPTFFLLLILHFYFKRMFYVPMDKVLRERDDAIQGVRKVAEQSSAKAAQLSAEFEAGLAAARNDIYREQDERRKEWNRDRAAAIEEARVRARSLIEQARTELAGEAARAKAALAGETDRLAHEIARSILRGRLN